MNFFHEVKNKCTLLKESNLLTEDAILKAQQNLSDLLDGVIQKLSALPDTTDDLKETKQGLLDVFKNLEAASDEIGSNAGKDPGGFSKFMGMIKRSDPKQQKQDAAAAQISYIITHVEMNMAMFETVINGVAEWMNEVAIKDEEIQFIEGLEDLLNKAPAETQTESYNLVHRKSLSNLLLEEEGGGEATKKAILESAQKVRINSFLSDSEFDEKGALPHRPSIILNWAINFGNLFSDDEQKKKDVEKLSKKFEKAEQSSKRTLPGLKQEMAKSAKEKQKELGKMVSDMKDLLLPDQISATTMSPEVLLGKFDGGGILTLGWSEFKEFAGPIKKEIIDKSEGILQKMQGDTEVSAEAQGLIDAGEPYMKAMANSEVFKDLSEKDKAVLAIVMASSQASPEDIFKESLIHRNGLSLLMEDKRVVDALKLVKDYKWDMSPEVQQKVFDYLNAAELIGGSKDSGELNLDVQSKEYKDALAIAMAALAPAIEPDKLDNTPINVGNAKTDKVVGFEFTSPEKHVDFFKEIGLENPEAIITDLSKVKDLSKEELESANLGPEGEDALIFTDDDKPVELEDKPSPMDFTDILQAILDEEKKWMELKIPGAEDGFAIDIGGKSIPIQKVFPPIIDGDKKSSAPFIKILKKKYGNEYEKELSEILEDFKLQLEDAKTQKLIDDLANVDPDSMENKVENIPEDDLDSALSIDLDNPGENPDQMENLVDTLSGGSDSEAKTIKKQDFIKGLPSPQGTEKDTLDKVYDLMGLLQQDEGFPINLVEVLSIKSIQHALLENTLLDSKDVEEALELVEDEDGKVLKYLLDKDVQKYFKDTYGISWRNLDGPDEGGSKALKKKDVEKFLDGVEGLKKSKSTYKVISAYLDAHPNVTLESALNKNSMAGFLFEAPAEIEDIVSWAEKNWKKAKIDKDDLKRVLKNLKDEDVVKFLADEAGIEAEAESDSGPPAFIKKSKFKDFHQAFASAAEDQAIQVAINKSFLDKKKTDGSQDLRNAINVGAEAAGITKPVFQETIERWRKLAGIIKD